MELKYTVGGSFSRYDRFSLFVTHDRVFSPAGAGLSAVVDWAAQKRLKDHKP